MLSRMQVSRCCCDDQPQGADGSFTVLLSDLGGWEVAGVAALPSFAFPEVGFSSAGGNQITPTRTSGWIRFVNDDPQFPIDQGYLVVSASIRIDYTLVPFPHCSIPHTQPVAATINPFSCLFGTQQVLTDIAGVVSASGFSAGTTTGDLNAATRTASSVAQTLDVADSAAGNGATITQGDQYTFDVTDIIQDVVNEPTWTGIGAGFQLMFDEDGSFSNATDGAWWVVSEPGTDVWLTVQWIQQ